MNDILAGGLALFWNVHPYLWRASFFRLKLETTKYIDELGKIAIQFSSTSFWKAPLSGCDRFGKVRDEWNNDHQKMSNDINQSESLWIQLHILRECFWFWLVWFWGLGKFSGWVFNFNHPYISINGNSRNADWWSSPAKTVWSKHREQDQPLRGRGECFCDRDFSHGWRIPFQQMANQNGKSSIVDISAGHDDDCTFWMI